MGMDLAPEQASVLVDYMDHLQRWNRVYNLTALRDPEQILVQHIMDSLSVVAPMRKAMETRTEPVTIVDVGSGGGWRGVVVAATTDRKSVVWGKRVYERVE